VRMRTAVVLPAPLGPSKPKTVPRGTSNDTESSARTVPNCLTRLSAVMALDMDIDANGPSGERHPSFAELDSGSMYVIDTTAIDFWADPQAALREARRSGPVARDRFGTPILLDYADVEAALRDPRLINDYDVLLTRHGVDRGPLFDWWKLAMLNTNPPVHTRLRALANRSFTPRGAEAWRARMRQATIEHLARLPSRDIDFIEAVAEPLPLAIVCDLIGVPPHDHATFHRWVADLGLMFSDVLDDVDRSIAEPLCRWSDRGGPPKT
jgi:cytochrome P450